MIVGMAGRRNGPPLSMRYDDDDDDDDEAGKRNHVQSHCII